MDDELIQKEIEEALREIFTPHSDDEEKPMGWYERFMKKFMVNPFPMEEMQSIVEMEQLAGKREDVTRDITFRDLRNYLSRIDRLSICMLETLSYENYIYIRDVPDTYDMYYVYGIGMIESEFYEVQELIYAADGEPEKRVFLNCIEVMLSEKPKSVLLKEKKKKAEIENEED